jgi:hypothetical protein
MHGGLAGASAIIVVPGVRRVSMPQIPDTPSDARIDRQDPPWQFIVAQL